MHTPPTHPRTPPPTHTPHTHHSPFLRKLRFRSYVEAIAVLPVRNCQPGRLSRVFAQLEDPSPPPPTQTLQFIITLPDFRALPWPFLVVLGDVPATHLPVSYVPPDFKGSCECALKKKIINKNDTSLQHGTESILGRFLFSSLYTRDDKEQPQGPSHSTTRGPFVLHSANLDLSSCLFHVVPPALQE